MAYKIAIIANSCWNIYNFRRQLIRHFKEAGHEIYVFAADDEFCSQLELPPKVTFQTLHFLKPVSINPIWDVFCFFEILRKINSLNPDLLINYTVKPNIYGGLAARVLGINAVSNLTGLGFSAQKSIWQKLILGLYKIAIQRNKVVVFHNEDDRHWFVSRNLVGDAQSVTIPGSGVDSEYFKPDPQNRDGSKFVFLFVGRLIRTKGIYEYLEAAENLSRKYPHAEWWIVGKQIHAQSLIQLDEDFDLYKSNKQIRFFGFQQNVRQYLRQAQIFVLPSYREGMSRALLEAMSMELPVITTRVAGCKHAIEQKEHGILVEPRNARALSIAMEECLSLTETDLKQMGKRCRQKILDTYETRKIEMEYDRILNVVMNPSLLKRDRYVDAE